MNNNKLSAEIRGNPYRLLIEWDEDPYDAYVSMLDPMDGSRMRTRFTFGELRDLRRILKGFTG